jgi:hypothetical protein
MRPANSISWRAMAAEASFWESFEKLMRRTALIR